MAKQQTINQQIAVFGESGSGKTVLISSFFGATQQKPYKESSDIVVNSDSVGQASRLMKNYLGMRDKSELPFDTRFASESYGFTMNFRPAEHGQDAKKNRLHLTWHDYPGQWFEQDVHSEAEHERRVDSFRTLLGSDVALLLVDGQKLRDHAGEEELYLKSLFSNFRNGLVALKDDLLGGEEGLTKFPRIWMIALSKSDLIPEMDVYAFRDMLLLNAADDIQAFREAVEGFVKESRALSIGEDFMLLSAMRFESRGIILDQRVGMEVILPLSFVVPLQRKLAWAEKFGIADKALALAPAAARFAAGLVQKTAPGLLAGKVGRLLAPATMAALVGWTVDQLGQTIEESRRRGDLLRATMAKFALDLERAEQDHVLMRSTE